MEAVVARESDCFALVEWRATNGAINRIVAILEPLEVSLYRANGMFIHYADVANILAMGKAEKTCHIAADAQPHCD